MTQPELFATHTALATLDETGRTVWVIGYPAPAPIVSINQKQHWAKHADSHRIWRNATRQYAQAAKLPTGLHHVRIDIELRFPTAARRDPPNYHPHVAKPIIDGLGPGRRYRSKQARDGWITEQGHGLIPDDTPTFLDGPHISIGTPTGRGKNFGYGYVTLTITNLGAPDDRTD